MQTISLYKFVQCFLYAEYINVSLDIDTNLNMNQPSVRPPDCDDLCTICKERAFIPEHGIVNPGIVYCLTLILP